MEKNFTSTINNAKQTKAATVVSSYFNATKKETVIKARVANAKSVVTVHLKDGEKVQPYLTAGKMISYSTNFSVENAYTDGRKYTNDYTAHVLLGAGLNK